MIRAASNGGGVQSTAMLILSAQRVIDYPLHLFANTGDDSEHPATLAYVREVAMPYAEAYGIELVELRSTRHGGETLLERIRRDERSVPIPMRLAPSGAPGNRACTGDFKIKVIAKELKRRGATKDDPATTALGISLDEYHRARTESGIAWQRLAYPLIERRLDRAACVALIEREGLPVPPKSACWFCPYKSVRERQRQRRDEPDIFAQTVAVERLLHDRSVALGRGEVFLTRALRPLDQVIGDHDQLDLFEDGATCDIGGYCHA